MTPRRLVPVVLDGSVQTGDKLPLPRLGEIAAYAVGFAKADEYTDPADPWLTTVTARVEPLCGGQSVRVERLDGTPFEQRPTWSSYLHAEGWSALWASLRPPPPDPGPVELRGTLTIDFGALCPCWVRGRVAGLWMTYSRRDRAAEPSDPASREPVWGSQGRTALEGWPTRMEDWPSIPTGANESGVLVELDLDDVSDGRTGGVRR